MVMIAAGSLIITIPEASAVDVVTFTIVPTDGDTQLIVYNCEAIVRRYSNPEEYSVFQAEVDGTIDIDTSQLSWEFSYNDPEVEIGVTDSQNDYAFEDQKLSVQSSIQGVLLSMCMFNKKSLGQEDQGFTCHGGPYDSAYEDGQKGMPINGFTYAGTGGEVYFINTYHAHLTAKNHHKGETWRMVISDFYFEAWIWFQGDKLSRIERKNHGQEVILAISNTKGESGEEYGKDDHFDPQFKIKFTRTNQPITNAYYFEWGASWELQYYCEDKDEWQWRSSHIGKDDCIIPSYNP